MYDAVANAQKKKWWSWGCTMQLQMYKRRMIKNKLQKGVVMLEYIPTEEHVVDVLTKPLYHVEYFWDKFGLVRKDLPQKREWWCECGCGLYCHGVVAQSRIGMSAW